MPTTGTVVLPVPVAYIHLFFAKKKCEDLDGLVVGPKAYPS
jgi:hypothetical protein